MNNRYPLKLFINISLSLVFFLSLTSSGQFSPVITDITDREINEGGSFAPISLDEVVSDPDQADDQLVWNYANNDELLVTIENRVAQVAVPDVNWFGNETITFIVTDPDSNTSSDEATFTVLSVNDAPVVMNIPGESIAEGTSFSPINLDNFVSDVDHNKADLNWTASPATNLSVNISAAHVAVIEPNAGWSGTETISFTAEDPDGASGADNADFTVTAVEAVPVADNDNYEVDEGGTLSTPAPGVLSNDTDADGDALSAVLISNPLHDSQFNLGEDGSILYVHDGTSGTSDVFTYAASDGKGQSPDAMVTITVNPINDNPVITDVQNQSLLEGQNFQSFDLDDFVTDEESPDGLLAWEATGSTDLKVSINPSTHIASINPPNNNWSGSETITFTVTDPAQGSDSDNATFSMASVAEAPVAVADNFNVNEGETLNPAVPGVLENDTDGDGDALTADLVSSPLHSAAFTLNDDGSFTYTHNGNETGDDSFTYRAFDGTDFSNTVTVTLNVIPQNDPPVVSDIPNETILEGASFPTINLNNFVSDPDNPDDQINWSFSGNSQLGVSISSGNVATITVPSADFNGSENITFIATDPADDQDSDAALFTVTGVNDNPALAGIEGGAITYNEGDGKVTLTNSLTVADADNSITSAVVSISSNYQNSQDVLEFITAFGITGSWNSSTGQLTLTGTATPANYQSALRTVTYENTSTDPLTLTRTISFVVNDGTVNSNTVTRNITINSDNSAPVLNDPASGPIAFTENDGPLQLTNTITVADDDNAQLVSAQISISSGFKTGEDVLSFTPANGITGTFNTATGQLPLSGNATLANYRTALRSVRYNNISEAPDVTNRIVTFTVHDGTSPSNTVNKTVTVSAFNDNPVLAAIEGTAKEYTEGDGAVQITNTLTVNDADNPNLASATVSISSGYQSGQDVLSFVNAFGITGTWNTGTGQLNLTGSASPANYQNALHSVTYTNTSPNPNTSNRTVRFVVNDGTGTSNAQTRTITLEATDNPPVLADPSVTPVVFTEGGPSVRITNTIIVADEDNTNLVSASVAITSGLVNTEDVLTFTATAGISGNYTVATGILSFTGNSSLANYQTLLRSVRYNNMSETPAETDRIITFTVNDGTSSSLPLTKTLTITGLNDPPVATDVIITAPNPYIGTLHTGSFTFADPDGDDEGTHLYKWYRSTNSNGTGAIVIPGAILTTYTPVIADDGMYISFEVTPVDENDLAGIPVKSPYRLINKFSASISGSDTFCLGTAVPVILTITGGELPYTAVLHRAGTLAKDTTITAINSTPRNITVRIPGTYTLKEVTDQNGDKADVNDSDPVVLAINPRSKALISGTASICRESGSKAQLSLNFTSGVSPWTVTLRRQNSPPFNDTTISNITADPYNFMARVIDDGPTVHRIVAITDASGCPGDTASGSATISYRTSPRATITGSDSICAGTTANLTVTLAEGTSPWSFTYARNGVNQAPINNIDELTRTVQVNQPGTYTITAVSDASGPGCGTGQAIIIARTPPTATISGTATICEHTSGNLSVALTGKSPWKFGYSRNLVELTEVENVTSSPKSISVMKPGSYRIYEVIDRHGCQGSVSGVATITITPAPEVEISGIKAAYNIESPKIDTLIGNPVGGTFTGPGVFGIYFIPRLAPLGTHNIIYTYRASPASCYGYDTTQVSILESNAIINFENDRTKYCLNDAPFTVTGVNLEGSEGEFSISGNKGLQPTGLNTAVIDPSVLSPNKYTITYTYSIDGEPFHETADFDIGTPPSAVFNWATECFHEGQSISFSNSSASNFGFLTDTSYLWKIYTHTGFDSDSNRNITYTFNDPGIYEIELRIVNTYGCADTVIHDLNLRPTINLESMHFESFEDSPISWQSGKSSAYPVNSWQLGNPSKHGTPPHGFSGAYQGTKCWYTNITSSPAPREQSWVTSPCFDFTGIDKPMLTMQIWRLFNSNRDGANLQFTTDSARTWNLVGELEDGENWFNSYDIRGIPGNSPMGWSNNNGISNDGGWVRARHALDFLKGKTDVQFRVSYGSGDSPQNNDGIAFDNFLISERTKMTLIEHFTNSSSPQAEKADSILDALTAVYGENIVDIQYHTSNPAGDPFYAHNPLVPTARQFYYGLSAVPYAVIDGGNGNLHQVDYNDLSKPLRKNTLIVQSLKDSEFDIRAEGEMSGDIVNVHVWIRPKVEFPFTELSLRIAIVERIIDEVEGNNGDGVFRNVVRAMLPDAAGTLLNRSWHGEDEKIDVSWNIENVYDRDELEVVAFLQNESTREIYNVDVDSVVLATGTDYPTIVDQKVQFTVYPNPARHLATVTLSQVPREDVLLELYDNVGRLIFTGRIPAGDRQIEIPVEEYRDGLYLLRLLNERNVLGIRKVIISK